ncbi:MAG TPA: hypothetical protein VN541_00760, partial [Tepidisphaeraceae bacterium]|nr:hypothetical protein [Tepidisphaeraceae bacterium]
MTALTTLPPGIRSYLDEFIARSRWLALLRSSGLGTALFLGWMLVACVTDRYVHLPESARVAALLIGIAAFLACVGPAMLAFRRRPDWVSAAASVERHNPRFRQRLLTVTSRVLGAADYRGSDEILLRLVHEVDEELSSERTSKMLPVRQPLASWTVAVLLLVLIAGLSHLAPSLRFNALAIRFLDPLANVPPVTTTELSVTPGDFEIVQAQPLVIRATAARLGNRPLMLHLSDDARSWSHVAMIPAGSDAFAFTLASVDRDLRYFLSGGDARTPEYSIRVLRKPVVAQFRIHYEYPAYTRLPITVETNSTGRIEAPVGTKVLLTITSSEPLQDALLTIGGERILMDRTADPHIRQAALVVRNGGPYSIDLISARDVPGFGPSGMSIHALVDSPPQVHLARQGDSLRLRPRDVLPLTYEALDDYGIQALFVRAQLGRKPAGDSPVRIWGDPRRQQDTYTFDLANLQLAIGDVLTLTLFATDTAGHTTHSDPLYVLISPKATDVDAYDRLAELRSAGQLAGTLASELQDAAKAHDEVAAQKDRHSQVSLSAISRGDRALTSASQTVTLLRQALLRAMVHSPGPAFSLGLAQWIDAGEIESAVAQETFRQSGSPSGLSPAMGRQLAQAAESANRIRDQMNDLAQSEQASLLLSDREDLADAGRQPRRSSAALDRMKKEFDAQAAQAGLDPASADFERQLRNRVAAGQHLLEAARPLDFAPAVETWAGELKRDPQQRLGLESRLAAAAQAEALRPDADLPRARDLELASRAAAAISTSARGSGQLADAQTLSRFVHDVALLLDEKSTSPGAA